jgi:hypothetical protein
MTLLAFAIAVAIGIVASAIKLLGGPRARVPRAATADAPPAARRRAVGTRAALRAMSRSTDESRHVV